jgi:protein dithiol oxidoreductase (disulfide-forming)
MRKIFIILLLGAGVFNAKAQFVEGKNYDVVSETVTKEPTVTEFFSFYCGHCYQFESMLDEYKKGLKSGTNFEKSHVNYIPRDNPAVQLGIVKAYLVIQALDMDEKLRPAFFDYIHVQAKVVETEAAIKEMFVSNGVSASDFDKHYNNSELVKTAVTMAAEWKVKKVSMVPTLVVNGKYKVNMNSVGTLDDLIKLTNFLLEKK